MIALEVVEQRRIFALGQSDALHRFVMLVQRQDRLGAHARIGMDDAPDSW
jgi:hypothetical protein